MKAAVIEQFGVAPVYGDFTDPEPAEGETVLEVAAAGLHQLVRGQASGQHYSSGSALPQVPGADGVARLPDGRHAWFGGIRRPFGTMAAQAPVRTGGWVVLPEGADPAQVAGQVNPAMSAWMALRARADLQAGQTVLVLGATGASGRQAVQIAKYLGAGRVIAAGRNPDALAGLTALGADHLVRLNGPDDSGGSGAVDGPVELDGLESEVDIVLDYLWGAPMLATMTALLAGRDDPGRPLTLVQIGSMAGRSADLPANALRSHNLRLVGSGIGSTPLPQVFAEMPRLIEAVATGAFRADVRAVPLSRIGEIWDAEVTPGERIVLIP